MRTNRIVNLETYLDEVLPTLAETEWVEATFSTLEQYEATCDDIAEIDAKLAQMKSDIDSAKAADIAAYGLTPLEKILEYKGFLESDYYDYNLQYLNVAIGKCLTSWDYVKALSDYCEANGIY